LFSKIPLKDAIDDRYAISHLHIKVKESETPVDPRNYMKTEYMIQQE